MGARAHVRCMIYLLFLAWMLPRVFAYYSLLAEDVEREYSRYNMTVIILIVRHAGDKHEFSHFRVSLFLEGVDMISLLGMVFRRAIF